MKAIRKLLIKIMAVAVGFLICAVSGYAYDAGEELTCDVDELNSDSSAQFSAQWTPISWTVHPTSSLPVVSGTLASDFTCSYDGTCAAPNKPTLTSANNTNRYFEHWAVSCVKSDGTTSCSPSVNTINPTESLRNVTDQDGATITLAAVYGYCLQCSPTNATCEVSAASGSCVYTTQCLDGYGNIQGNGTASPSCSPNRITLNWANGGYGGAAPTEPAFCDYGSTFTMPAALSETNYTFNGWSLNGTVYAPGTTGVPCNYSTLGTYTGSVTITGVWNQTSVTCAAGEYLPGNSNVCAPCNAGEFCPNAPKTYNLSTIDQGNTECTIGSYTSTTGATSCDACQDGLTTSGTGKTSCDATCPNADHARTWNVTTWNRIFNRVDNLCNIRNCMTGYEVTAENGNGLYTNICTAKSVGLSYVDSIDGSTITTDPTSCTYDTTFNLPDEPVRQGYRFSGWELVQ